MAGSSLTGPRFVFELLHDSRILVSYQDATVPYPREVREYGQLIAGLADDPGVRCLWYTGGARLSRTDQERLSRVPKHQWRVAIVSGSPDMRFVASAFSLVNRNLRYFTPEELPQALRHLQCNQQERDEFRTYWPSFAPLLNDPRRTRTCMRRTLERRSD